MEHISIEDLDSTIAAPVLIRIRQPREGWVRVSVYADRPTTAEQFERQLLLAFELPLFVISSQRGPDLFVRIPRGFFPPDG